MKTLEIIYGSNLGRKNEIMYSEMKSIAEAGGKILYIVPEQYAFNADKTVLFELGEKYSHLTETINFKRMAIAVNDKLHPNKRDYITEEIKNLILYKIYLDNRSKFRSLKYRGSSPDSVILFKDILTELKTNLITADELSKVMEKLPENSLLYGKLWDLNIISKEYDRYIEESYRDFSDSFLSLCENIKNHGLYKDYHVFIDNFTHLSASETLVVKELFKNAKSVHLTLLLDNFREHREGELFFLTKNMYDSFSYLAEKENYRLQKTLCDTEDDSILEIFQDKSPEREPEKIILTEAKTRTDEIRNLVYNIKNLIKNGASYNDIAVFAGDISTYDDVIASLFRSSEIPYFDDRKIPVSQNPVCRLILNVFSFYLSGYRSEEMICYVKSLPFLYDINEGVCFFEMAVTTFHTDRDCVKSLENWQTAMDTALKGSGYLLYKKPLINSVYEKFVLPVTESFGSLKSKNLPEAYTQSFFNFIKAIKLEECLKKFLQSTNNRETASQAVSAYNMIISAIKNIEKIQNGKELLREDWFNLLNQSAGIYKTGVLPNLMDGVLVSDTERGRTENKKYVFILGLNDTVTPKTDENTGFLSDADRQLIESVTGTFLPTSIWKNNSSILSLYRACTLATEKLYISKSNFTDEGNELTASFVWNKMLDYVGKCEEFKCDYVNLQEATQIVVSKGMNQENPAYSRVNEKNSRLLNDIKETEEENYFDVKKTISKKLLNSRFQGKLNTSVSRLETYRKCSYSYFLRYLLKLQEPENVNYDFAKTGTLVHDIIDMFSKKLSKEGIDWSDVTKEYAEAEAKSMAYYEIKEKFPKMNMFNPRTKYLVSKLTKTAVTAIMYIREHFMNGNFVPIGYEIEVNENGLKPIRTVLRDGTVLEIYGRIDRADSYFDKNSNTLYVRIIDYKSSKKVIDFTMVKEGIQLQLLTYLATLVKNGNEYMDFKGEILPGAALYMAFDHSLTRFDTKPMPEEIKKAVTEKFMMDGIILNDDEVISAIDRELKDSVSYKSQNVNISTDKEGKFNIKNLLYREQFSVLLEDCENLIKETGEKIVDGEFFIKPYRFSDKTACDYCVYKGICNFDNTVNSYRNLSKVSKDDYFENDENQEKKL